MSNTRALRPVPRAKPTFTLFALAELRGQIGPCGCTSDPLGDISRTTRLVDDARRDGPVLVVDAGSLLYSESPVPPQLDVQEEIKADLLREIYERDLQVAALGLGPADLAKGAPAVRMARQVANLAPGVGIAVDPPKLMQVGSAMVGVFGVIATGTVPGLAITDPIAAGKAAVAELRRRGAQIIVGLVQAPTRKEASHLARDIDGIDVAVAGLGANAPEPDHVDREAEKLGDGWLVVPVNRGQIVSRLDITIPEGQRGPLADAVGPSVAAVKVAALDKRIADADVELGKLAGDKDADAKYVDAKRAERARLVAERERLHAQPFVVPANGAFFTLDQIRVDKKLACSIPVQTAITGYDRTSGEANVKAAAAIEIRPASRGQASFVGMTACADCHQDAVDFWTHTVHARAWATLEDRGQQFDYSCISCHVTGFDRPGGSNLGHNDHLRDVQCETCHGPGSIHVAKRGEERPLSVVKAPAEELCAAQCHTREHSDTFVYDAYLRDIIGKGHGEERRKRLGEGPTGHSLRGTALEKAGQAVGDGCKR